MSVPKTKKAHISSLDALRVIAILGVVLIHVTTKTLAELNLQIDSAPLSFFLNQASRFAVPLFFLISGFVLEYNYKDKLNYKVFFKKRASKIIIPFVFWSIIYSLYLSGFNFYHLFTFGFLSNLIQGLCAYHLYFIPTLIIFYLAFPFLHRGINYLKNPFFLSFLMIVELIFLFYDYYIQNLPLQHDLRVATLSYSVFILGMVASHFKNQIFNFTKKQFLKIVILLLVLIISMDLLPRHLMLKYNSSSFMYNQYHPISYLYTAVLTLFLFYILEKTKFLERLFVKLSALSFFVFFIHVLLLYILWDYIMDSVLNIFGADLLKNFWFDPLQFVVIAGISFLIAYFIHKIPYAYKITG